MKLLRHPVLASICAGLLLVPAGVLVPRSAGQPSSVVLFTSVVEDVSGDPPIGVGSVFFVDLDLEGLRTGPEMVEIELPNKLPFTAHLAEFQTIEGFDGSGVPLPGSTLEDSTFVWRGRGDSHDVILAVGRGVINGIINGPLGHFSIDRSLRVDALLELVPDGLPEEPPIELPPAPASAEDVSFEERLRALREPSPRIVPDPIPEILPTANVTMLVLYEDLARAQSGGDPYDPDDIGPILGLIHGSVGDLNSTLENSLIDARVSVAHIERFDEIELTAGIPPDLIRDTLQANSTARSLRDQFDADVVAWILRNRDGFRVTHCGFAYTQRPGCGDHEPIPGCGLGPEFQKFPYFWTARDCARNKHSYVHEFGHLGSAEHQHTETGIPRDRAAYFFAFAHVVGVLDPITPEDLRFRTVMAGGSVQRVLYFSNPNVILNGFPTGVVGESDNAQAISLLINFMAGFRGPPTPFIFADGLERGDTLLWDP